MVEVPQAVHTDTKQRLAALDNHLKVYKRVISQQPSKVINMCEPVEDNAKTILWGTISDFIVIIMIHFPMVSWCPASLRMTTSS